MESDDELYVAPIEQLSGIGIPSVSALPDRRARTVRVRIAPHDAERFPTVPAPAGLLYLLLATVEDAHRDGAATRPPDVA